MKGARYEMTYTLKPFVKSEFGIIKGFCDYLRAAYKEIDFWPSKYCGDRQGGKCYLETL